MHSRTSSGPTQRAIAWGLTPSKRVLYRRRAPSYAGSPGRSSGPRSPRARAFQSAAREGAAERDATEVGVAVGDADGGSAVHPARPAAVPRPARRRNARRSSSRTFSLTPLGSAEILLELADLRPPR